MRLASKRSAAAGTSATCSETRAEVLLEVAAALASEDSAVIVAWKAEEVFYVRIRRVVQVGHAGEAVGVVGQNGCEAQHVVAVVPNLKRRVRDWPVPVLLDPNQGLAVLEPLSMAPLLQLDHEVGRPTGLRMLADEDHVGPLAGERELVLDEHLHVVEAGGHEVGTQRRDASLPGAALAV